VTVISLAAEREARGPQIAGPARCTACNHSWVAVAPVGTAWLECPSCSTSRGLFRFPALPASRWVCRCGCDAFAITKQGLQCYRCGKLSDV